MTGTPSEVQPEGATTWETIIDWTKVNSRVVMIGAAVVVVAAAGYWFMMRSRELAAASAERALMLARRSMEAGNLPLAQSDLQKVYNKYGSTSAGVQAAMLLAQIDYDQGKYQDGVNVLKDASGKSAAAPMTATIRSLIGDGNLQLKKTVDAAKEYEAAAAASGMDNERAFERAKAARAYAAGGDTATARRIWTELRDDPKTTSMATEARVRLGELEAKVASK
jgi:hypothetical protein